MESDYFIHTRFRTQTPSKKGHIPTITGLLFPAPIQLELFTDKEGNKSIAAKRENDESDLIGFLKTNKRGKFIIPIPNLPKNDKLFSRFLGKVALEVLAQRLMIKEEGLELVTFDKQLDALRKYARFGEGLNYWPFNKRRIYPEDLLFSDKETGEIYDVLHEYTLLYTRKKELYLILAIYGVEYVINFGGPQIEGYKDWLRENNNRSYLEMVE